MRQIGWAASTHLRLGPGSAPCSHKPTPELHWRLLVESRAVIQGLWPSTALDHQPRLTQGIYCPYADNRHGLPRKSQQKGKCDWPRDTEWRENRRSLGWGKTGSQRLQDCPRLELPLRQEAQPLLSSPLPLLKTIGARTQHWLLLVLKPFLC